MKCGPNNASWGYRCHAAVNDPIKNHTWFRYPQTPPNWNHPTSTEHLVYEIHLRQCDFLEPHVFHWELHTLLSIVSALEKITILHITRSFPPVIWKGTSMQSKCTLIPVNKCSPKVQLCVVTEHTACSLQVLIPHHRFITKTSEYIPQILFKPNFPEHCLLYRNVNILLK